ncbi:MFS transporter [Streptococcus sp. Marseille-P7376]|uniref:MFS transporter n=1 Tax=Streptococcus sp. Marseille-P7376 TaxID=2592044 RepID=UPI0011E6716D|nr:MFS transporter [Streptococcus sp. Marseille-P7376]
MKKFMEKVSILSLSLVLTTAFSVSSAQSAMFAFYKDLPESWVELLVSLPSAGIMLMLLLNGRVEKYLSERQMIVAGLLIFSLCGFVPLLNQDYWVIFASRFIFGMGVGLLNAKAISIISERYRGKERIQTLGLRGSAEVVGTALLTLGVSQLLRFGWEVAFLVYASGLIVLALYLLFVPYGKEEKQHKTHQAGRRLTASQWFLTIGLAFVAAVIVFSNVVINLRVPGIVEKSGMGSVQTAGLILSAMQLIGIVAGLSFSPLLHHFKENLLTLAGAVFGLTLIMIGLAPNLFLLSMTTIAAGFAYNISLIAIFHILSERIPSKSLNQATSIAILGCSSGATSTTFVLSLIGNFSSQASFIFGILGALMVLIAVLAFSIVKKTAV